MEAKINRNTRLNLFFFTLFLNPGFCYIYFIRKFTWTTGGERGRKGGREGGRERGQVCVSQLVY